MTPRNTKTDIGLDKNGLIAEVLAMEGVHYKVMAQKSMLERWNNKDSQHVFSWVISHNHLHKLCQNTICNECAVSEYHMLVSNILEHVSNMINGLKLTSNKRKYFKKYWDGVLRKNWIRMERKFVEKCLLSTNESYGRFIIETCIECTSKKSYIKIVQQPKSTWSGKCYLC